MAEEYDAQRVHECEAPVVREEIGEGVEVKDRGIFDFVGKKDGEEETEHAHGHGHGHHHHHHHHRPHHGEEVKEEVIATELEEKAKICEEEKPKVDEKKEKEKKHKLGGSDSSSSSDEEDEEKKKNKKDKKKKEKKEKEEKKEEEKEEKRIEETAVPVEKCDEEVPLPLVVGEKKGFLEKIKEKIPVVGSHAKKSDEVAPPPPPPPSDFEAAAVEGPPACNEGEFIGKEKKGFLEKIKEKIPGYHPKSHEEDKEKESAAST